MEKVNKIYLKEIRNIIRTIESRLVARKEKYYEDLTKHIQNSNESLRTRSFVIELVKLIKKNNNLNTVESLLTDYHPMDTSPDHGN